MEHKIFRKPEWVLRTILLKLYEKDKAHFNFPEDSELPLEVLMKFIKGSLSLAEQGEELKASYLQDSLRILFPPKDATKDNWLEEELRRILSLNLDKKVKVRDVLDVWDVIYKTFRCLSQFVNRTPARVRTQEVTELKELNDLFLSGMNKIAPDESISIILSETYLQLLTSSEGPLTWTGYYDLTCLETFITEQLVKPTLNFLKRENKNEQKKPRRAKEKAHN